MTASLPGIRIGLVWHSHNSDNLGVGALSLASIAILKETASSLRVAPEFVILGWTDPKPYYFEPENVEVVGLRMKDFIKLSGGSTAGCGSAT